MAIQDRLYKVAGMSRDPAGTLKVRYSGEALALRIKLYVALGHTEVDFFELPRPMNKVEVCQFLLGGGLANITDEQRRVIEVELGKKVALVTPKVPKKRGPKPKADKAAKAAKTPRTKRTPKAAPSKPTAKVSAKKDIAPKREIGEVETLEVIEDDADDFDIRQFERLAAEQI